MIYIAVYINDDDFIESQNAEVLPAVYIQQESLQNNTLFGYNILYHKNEDLSSDRMPSMTVPFVSKCSSNYALILINKICEVIKNQQITEESLKKLEDVYKNSGKKIKEIDEILKNGRKKNRIVDLIEFTPLRQLNSEKCSNCNGPVYDTYPIRIKCNSHTSCIKCIVENFNQNCSSACYSCGRKYQALELSLIQSFIV